MNDKKTLFEHLARHQAERTIQGAFCFAMNSLPGCRRLVLARAGRAALVDATWTVDEEAAEEVTAWRSDVAMHAVGDEPLRCELKLLAPLTANQVKARDGKVIDILVVPSSKRSAVQYAQIPTLSWSELAMEAEKDGDMAAYRLFSEADDYASALKERTTMAAMRADFGAFMAGGADARWREMYRFLNAVDLRLAELTVGYTPGSWSHSRKNGGWYGYWFGVAPGVKALNTFWIGMSQEKTGPELAFYEGRNTCLDLIQGDELRAEDVARKIAAVLGRATDKQTT